ncbi:MAG: recombinase family protein, partial [Bacteroidota bacterium]
SNLAQFQEFGIRGEEGRVTEKLICVIYTRVSSKKQADTNASLETQLKACREYADRLGFETLEEFGGTYESANTRNRKEFKRMMTYLRRNRAKVGHVVVYSPDRFVRDLEEGTQSINELKRMKIRLHTVTQSVDDDTPSGKLHRQIQMAFSEYDNQLRKEKCMAGILTRLEKGDYCGTAPFGYDNITRKGHKTIEPNEKAQWVRMAFEMKAYERIPNSEIVSRIRSMGGPRIYKQRLPEMFRNPIYCGLIRHKMLNGRVVQGVHEPIVSQELFLMVHELQQKNVHGYTWNAENDALPLKQFLCCEKCGKPLTGYLVKAKGLYYYKCNTKGCKVNKSAKQLNADFREILAHVTLDSRFREVAEKQLLATYREANKDKAARAEMLEKNRLQIERKLDRLEERFIDEEIDKQMFEKYRAKFKETIRQIDAEIEQAMLQLSNPKELIRFATEIAVNLAKMWDSATYNMKQRIQEMVFPEGMSFCKEKHIYRTNRLN